MSSIHRIQHTHHTYHRDYRDPLSATKETPRHRKISQIAEKTLSRFNQEPNFLAKRRAYDNTNDQSDPFFNEHIPKALGVCKKIQIECDPFINLAQYSKLSNSAIETLLTTKLTKLIDQAKHPSLDRIAYVLKETSLLLNLLGKNTTSKSPFTISTKTTKTLAAFFLKYPQACSSSTPRFVSQFFHSLAKLNVTSDELWTYASESLLYSLNEIYYNKNEIHVF